MTESYQVMCIRKRGAHLNPHERIEGIGGNNGQQWYVLEDNAIAAIEAGKWSFYTNVNGHSVWIVVASHNGRKYLKTEPDGYAPDNLLSLQECPLS